MSATNLDHGNASGPGTSPPRPLATADRRHPSRRDFRTGTPICPHCGGPHTPNHLRDTGDLTECPTNACPVLFAKRTSTADWTPPHGIPRPLHIVR